MLNNFIEDLRFLPRKYKKLLLIFSDYFLIFFSSLLCEFILVGYFPPISRSLLLYILIVTLLITVIFVFKNNYAFATRHFDTSAISSIIFSTFILVIILFLLSHIIKFRYLNYNFIFIQNLIFVFSTLCSRIFFKYFLYQIKNNDLKENKNLIFGASEEGIKFLKKNINTLNIIGFIDEDINKIGSIIENKRVYSLADVKKIIKKNKIKKVYVCAKSISEFKKNEIFSVFKNSKIDLEFPNFDQNNFFKDEVIIDYGKYENFFKDKTILITGCAGTIGQEIFLRLFDLEPKKIIGIDKNEEMIASLKINLNKKKGYDSLDYQLKLMDICNEENCKDLFHENNFDIIFHAAAYKHVDIVEQNPNISIYNNIIGLNNILSFSKENRVENFVFVSTDKAVYPSNIMGTTKRIGEIITNYYKEITKKNYISVRFGNVIGSSGSLLQILKKQLTTGGPLTLTHPEATRFFMTIKEAVSLVLKSVTIDDDGDIYVLKMGDPINIYSLIKKFLKNNGHNEKKDNGEIEIKIIGLRPGEKLHEELFYNNAEHTNIKSILKENIRHKMNDREYKNFISSLNKINDTNILNIKTQMKKLVDDYSK